MSNKENRLLFFLGSGCSRPTLGIGVHEISEAIVLPIQELNEKAWFQKTELGNYLEQFEQVDRGLTIPFLERIKNDWDFYFKSFSEDAGRNAEQTTYSNYEDWYASVELFKEVQFNRLPLTYDPYLWEKSNQVYQSTLESLPESVKRYVSDKTLVFQKLERHIETVVRLLLAREYSHGYEFLGLFRNFNYDIATLNHDLLIEDFFEKEKIGYNDGFARKTPTSVYDSTLFNSKNQVNIIKLHGGIDWEFADKVDAITPPQAQKLIKRTEAGAYLSLGEGSFMIRKDRSFLSGRGKERRYASGFFGSQWSVFMEGLNQTNKLIISGYGWSDRTINTIIWDWLWKTGNKALIMDENFPTTIENCRYPGGNAFDTFQRLNRLVVEPIYPVNFHDSDLKSIGVKWLLE